MSAWSAPGKRGEGWHPSSPQLPLVVVLFSRFLNFVNPTILQPGQANNRWDWKGATFSFTSCTGRVQIWLFSGTSHIHPQGNILLLPVENLESSLSHVSVNNDVTMERGDSGGSTLLFNKCILQYTGRYSINLCCNIEATDFQPDRKTTGINEH